MAVLTTQQKLDDARVAYHKLTTGQMARVFQDQNGERVEFTAARSGDLYLYIQRLELELSGAAPARVIGPIGFIF